METKVQNYIRYSTILTIIEIPENIENGQLIGSNGRNLKSIANKTGTHIHVIDDTNPTQIKIEINKKRIGNKFPVNRIDEAVCQINMLLEDIEIRNQRKETEKEKKDGRISNNGNNRYTISRNHKDNDSKEEKKSVKKYRI
ncbi:hypothetical protein RclHR1_19320001 [Rhizophagus clarus]|uniref:K Homology domain-containing protein n=1 Tax=Rhizophagus clarus TaxID=94130 RepID=A0A2Z6QP67_9GLOM|nr:hypothetical protein RclHR1_19320001 [Rhizophagus clarus]GES84480.1 hypothetical protein GLOIN_2v1705292 [Rhizophagus clarus]